MTSPDVTEVHGTTDVTGRYHCTKCGATGYTNGRHVCVEDTTPVGPDVKERKAKLAALHRLRQHLDPGTPEHDALVWAIRLAENEHKKSLDN